MQTLWARTNVSNNTIMVVQCDGPIAPERVRRAVARLLDFCPWPAARLRRGFPWGALHWAAGPRATLTPPPVQQRSVASEAALHDVLEAELNGAIDARRDPPCRFLALDHGSNGFLVVTWFHPLMDPRGAQNLLRHLSQLDESNGHAPWADALPAFVPERDPRPLRERGRLAGRGVPYMRALARVPVVSPGTGLTAPGRARFRRYGFVDRDPAGDTRVTREMCWRLAVVGQALAELWRRRGLPDIPFLVPISVDLRPKGDPGPTFGNALAFHFARFTPSETKDVAGLARTLRHHMADALREGLIEANAVGMQFLKYRPVSMIMRYLPGAASGETFSFNCADIADFPPALRTVFGRRIVNVYHAPAVLPRPGLGIFFNRCAGTNNLIVSWVDGAVSDEDVEQIASAVGEGMEWTSRP